MKCRNCGAELSEGLRFCTNCGTKIELPVPETVEEPAAEEKAAVPEQETVSQPLREETMPETPSPVSAKKSRKPLLFIMLAALIAIGGWFGYQQLPSVKYEKAASAGRQYTEQENYDAAIGEYLKALELRPKDQNVSSLAVQVWLKKGGKLLQEEKYEEALKTAEDAIGLVSPESAVELARFAESVYREQADSMAGENRFEDAMNLVDEGIEKGYSLAEDRERIAADKKKFEAAERIRSILREFAGFLDKEDYGSFNTAMKRELIGFNTFESLYGMNPPLLETVEGGTYGMIGLYPSEGLYAVYYGEYNGTQREGTGIYAMYAEAAPGNTAEYHGKGEWKNDAPNGQFSEYKKICSGNQVVREESTTVTVKDGIYDGEIALVRDGITFYGSFKNGIVTVIDEKDPNGEANRVTMYSKDKKYFLYYPNAAAYSTVFGVPGYGQY